MDGANHDLSERLLSFALRVVRLCQYLDKSPGVCRTLANQLLRSGTFIGANYEESQAAASRKDFANKVLISPKEARESRYWLRLMKRAEILPPQRIDDILDESDQIAKILGAIVAKTKTTKP